MRELAADERERQDRDPRGQPERAEPPQPRRRRQAGSGEVSGHSIVDTFYHIETPQDAAAEVIRVKNAYPEITGWAMIGGWPLFTQTLLTDLDPKKVKIVAVDALPTELPYVEKGLAPVLLAQPTYMWGNVGVRRSSRRSYKQDVPEIVPMDLVRVTKDNLGTWARQLRPWGFPDVPEEYLNSSSAEGSFVNAANVDTARWSASSTSPSDFRGRARSRTSASSARAARATRCAARTARARARSERSSAASIGPTRARSRSTGESCSFEDPRDALAAGVGMVHQELAFCENLSVAENLCLGELPVARIVRLARRDGGARGRCLPPSTRPSTCAGWSAS